MLEALTLGTGMEIMANRKQKVSPTARRYTPDEKAQTVRLVRTLRDELGASHGTIQCIANQLDYGVESLRSYSMFGKYRQISDYSIVNSHALSPDVDEREAPSRPYGRT
jgi:hypothetical protein